MSSPSSLQPFMSPEAFLESFPPSPSISTHITEARERIRDILRGKSSRLLVIIGPCSIHDPIATREYANLLKTTADRFKDQLEIVMRMYFEKPRTGLGWKGFINDPFLDGRCDIASGLKSARQLLLEVNSLNLPTATEFVNPFLSLYFSDLIAWGAIGARTSESQIHRELASSLDMPIGFKNSTDGNIKIAIDAARVARLPHHFLSLAPNGKVAIRHSVGNPDSHIILRGSRQTSNYSPAHLNEVKELLNKIGLHSRLIVDCSHGNSRKDYQKQANVLHAVIQQVNEGNQLIAGVMIESFLIAGQQPFDNKNLTYGQSITDGCIGWEETVTMLEKMTSNLNKKCG